MISRDEIDRLCARFAGATFAHPPELMSWKVGGKMFVCFGGEADMEGVSVKTDSVETAEMLIEAGAAIKAPYFHRSWIRLPFADTDPEEAHLRLRTSYDIVFKSLPKRTRETVAVAGDTA
ncbi:MmcQ/YjbR family DNA-binding protein [Aestuariibius insulae]|uniref:MmcQ/YjbR family DNA-binding protein n=1 Tax=Aestuariibius insulae TaxID=2058287 RepID=UPI00345EB247